MMILERVAGVLIVIFILGLCLFIVFWSASQLFKMSQKSKRNQDTKLHYEIESLKQRVESLERKEKLK
ncbi:hypothetical protein [Bacillus sp. AK128]